MVEDSATQGLVVVVDDDPVQRTVMRGLLARMGYAVEEFSDGEAFLDKVSLLAPECVCLDLIMPGLSGLEVLQQIKPRLPHLPVLVLTADASVENVVEAMRLGAYDYLVKPINSTRLDTAIRNAIERYNIYRRLLKLERKVQQRAFAGMVGASRVMRELFINVDRVAGSEITVLIRGESGTGKELVARAVHEQSARSEGPYLALNCAALPEHLVESELFGHERGAFTGADNRQLGLIESADGGTLFLDEIGELNMSLQAKLLRVLQERSFRRVGGERELSADFRLVCASNRDLAEAVQHGRFREDLFYRLAVFEIETPPLRARIEDIPLLASHFLAELAQKQGRDRIVLAPETLEALSSYPWPGNVRELRNTIERALVVCEGTAIKPRDLSARVLRGVLDAPVRAGGEPGSVSARSWPASSAVVAAAPPIHTSAQQAPETLSLENTERQAIERAIEQTAGNLSRATKLLGIGRTTLYRKMKKYEIVSPVR